MRSMIDLAVILLLLAFSIAVTNVAVGGHLTPCAAAAPLFAADGRERPVPEGVLAREYACQREIALHLYGRVMEFLRAQ